MIRPISEPVLVSGFWEQYQSNLAAKGLLAQWQQIVETGRLENFYRAARNERGSFKGFRFNDSDIYKWLEAAAYSQKIRPNARIAAHIAEAIDAIQSAQQKDGFINTWIQIAHPDLKFRFLCHSHELYCLGHLIEAAVALNDERLNEVATKAADCVLANFGPGKIEGSDGHPEIEIALYRLSDHTGESKYREFADWMIDHRGSRPSLFEKELNDPEHDLKFPGIRHIWNQNDRYSGAYGQDDKPIREQTEIVGHAVRATYLYTAAAWSAAGRHDQSLMSGLDSIWNNLNNKRMYATGGIGSTEDNEGFTSDYDLPNLKAYAETCAGISLMMWGRAMFQATGASEYLDTVERALFNGVLSGVSIDTTLYNYENPLESRSNHERKPWFGCACCPPNIARTIASVSQYAIYEDADTVYVAFPVQGRFGLESGFEFEIETDYPHSGKAKIKIIRGSSKVKRFAIRIPDWVDDVTMEFKAASNPAEYDNGFAVYEHDWKGGELIEIDLEMEPRWLSSNPRVLENIGRVALQYGPTIYCLESQDEENAPQLFIADVDEELVKGSQKALDGAPIWTSGGVFDVLEEQDELYAPVGDVNRESAEVEWIPYRTWNHAGPSYMQVWVRAE